MIAQSQLYPFDDEHEWQKLMRSCYYRDVYSDRPLEVGRYFNSRRQSYSLVRRPDGGGIMTMLHVPVVDGRLPVPDAENTSLGPKLYQDWSYPHSEKETAVWHSVGGEDEPRSGMTALSILLCAASAAYLLLWLWAKGVVRVF